jgi:MFS family permease
VVSSLRIAPWYFAYLILGLLTSGMLPFLMPLMVADISGERGPVAYVAGAYDVGLLAAPLFGKLAEWRNLYRPVFLGAFLVLGLAFVAFPFGAGVLAWFLLALLIGVGTGAAGTVATLFIVNFTAKTEWEPQIGWLQSFNGAGQLLGLLLGGAFAHGQYMVGFFVAGALTLPAILVGSIGLPVKRTKRIRMEPLARMRMLPLLHSTQLGPGFGGLLHHSHHQQWAAVRGLSKAMSGPFGRLLLAWAAYNFGVAGFFAYFPLMMRQSYGVPPAVTAATYAVAAGVGIFLFLAAGRLAVSHGSRIVFQAGLSLRLVGFLLLALPFVVALPDAASIGIALFAFMLAMMAWPVLSVSGTALTARLTPIGEGAAMGLLNASGALATVIGTFASGPLVHMWGYVSLPMLAVAGLAVAEFLMLGDADPLQQVDPARSDAARSTALSP